MSVNIVKVFSYSLNGWACYPFELQWYTERNFLAKPSNTRWRPKFWWIDAVEEDCLVFRISYMKRLAGQAEALERSSWKGLGPSWAVAPWKMMMIRTQMIYCDQIRGWRTHDYVHYILTIFVNMQIENWINSISTL